MGCGRSVPDAKWRGVRKVERNGGDASPAFLPEGEEGAGQGDWRMGCGRSVPDAEAREEARRRLNR